jgi:succinyl-CoA:acetate CoA-transferase
MSNIEYKRIRNKRLINRVVDPSLAAKAVEDGMVIATGGGPVFGYPKSFFSALAERGKTERIKTDLWSASLLGEEVDGALSASGVIRKRLGSVGTSSIRRLINKGEIEFIDIRSSLFPQIVRSGVMGNIDIAVVKANSITEEGYIVPSIILNDIPAYVDKADSVIVEMDTYIPIDLQGIHDIYLPEPPIRRRPIPIYDVGDRIGKAYIPVDPGKILYIVECKIPDDILQPTVIDEKSKRIAQHLIDFFNHEVYKGNLPSNLFPIEIGIGATADAVMKSFIDSNFENLSFYSAPLNDGILELIDAGKIKMASGTGLLFSTRGLKKFCENFQKYKRRIILRPIDVSNAPEVINRLGIIAINTAIEIDIFGHINSSHLSGVNIMSGIGGVPEFACNGFLSIFLTYSTTKQSAISSIVPFVSHCDIPEHMVDIIITENGVADIRGLSPRERAPLIIDRCAHPDYRPILSKYYNEAKDYIGGHEPHDLEKAFSFHRRFAKTGSMK